MRWPQYLWPQHLWPQYVKPQYVKTAQAARPCAGLGLVLLVAGLFFGAFPQTSMAQGTFQATVSNVPPVLSSPYVSDLEQNVRQGRYAAQLTYSAAGGAPVTVRLRVSLQHEGDRVADITSRPVTYKPGTYTYRTFEELPRLSFEESAADIVDQVRARLGNKVARSGVLPEGEYTLRVEPMVTDPSSMVSAVPGTAVTTVRFPRPPQLVSPANRSQVAVEMPVFSWTPAGGARGDAFEYELLIAQVLPQQTPLQAIEANRLVTGGDPIALGMRTSFSYTRELPPLEEGATYAWQVRARETSQRVPISDDGESEIYTFQYGTSEEEEDLADLSAIPLVPGFARLTELGGLDVREEDNAYVLNGEATLTLSFDDRSEPVATSVQLRNLRVQASDPSVLLGGRVEGAAPEALEAGAPPLLAPQSLRWRMGEGLRLQARVRGDDGDPIGNPGRLQLTARGPQGTLTATGTPITQFATGPVSVNVTQIRAQFPQRTLRASGTLQAFGTQTDCQIDQLRLGNEQSAVVDCTAGTTIPVGQDTTAAVRLQLRDLQGTVGTQWGRDSLDYDLTAEMDAEVDVENAESCGVRATLRLTSGAGTTIVSSRPNCPVPTPRIDLGLADLLVDRMDLETLHYRREEGWTVALTADAAAALPAFGGATLPVMEDLRITPSGISLPSLAYTEADLGHLDPFTVEGVQMKLEGLSASSTTVSWPPTGSSATSPWSFTVDLGLAFPHFNQDIPGCLQAATPQVTDAQVEGRSLSASIPATTFEQCRKALPPGSVALAVDQLGGRIETTSAADSTHLDPSLTVGLRLDPAPPLMCEGDESLALGRDALRLDTAEGLLDAEAGPVETSCGLDLGAFEAEMRDVGLLLAPSKERQEVVLAGTAAVQLNEDRTATGPFRLNLRTGQFEKLDVRIEGPFTIDLPRTDPALTVRVPGAQITTDGLETDGRGGLVLPQTTIGATFDAVRLGLRSRAVEAGRILIDRPFGFDARVDTSTQSLDLRAVGSSETATASPGLYFGLSGTPQIDSTGLTVQAAEEPAPATLDVPALTQSEGLEAVLSDSFAVGLSPFGIAEGRATIRRSDGGTLGYADRDGLHLTSLLAQGTVPARVPLPSKQTAYLRLKDEQGNLLVQTSRKSGGRIRISPTPNRSPELVLPAFRQGGSPVRLPVSLSQFTLDAASGTYASGSLTAAVPEGHPLRTRPLHPLPLALRTIRFGTEQVGGVQREALFFDGGLTIFGTAPNADQPRQHVTFYSESGTTAQAEIDLQNLDVSIPVAGSGKAVLKVGAVRGPATVPLMGGGSPSFDFQIDGEFALRTAGKRLAAADIALTYARPQGATNPRLSVGSISPQSLQDPASISAGSYKLAVPALKSLSLSYDAGRKAFTFDAAVDAELTFDLEGAGTFAMPLRHVTLDERGFELPKQSVSASSVPGLSLPRLSVGPAEIEVLALRTDAKTRFNWLEGGSFSLTPKLDLGVHLPTFNGTNVGPSQGITLSDVPFSGGTLTGSNTFTPTSPERLPLGTPSAPALSVTEITAELGNQTTGVGQTVNIDLTAALVRGSGPLRVPNAQQCPSPTTFTLSVVEGPGLEGQAQNTDPCGRLEWGPVTLEMTQAALAFSFQQGTQRLVATGSAKATLPNATENQPPITVRGQNVGVDLINGRITSGALTVGTPIRVPVPLDAQDPLLTFQVGQPGGARPVARLDQNGLTIGQVSGSLDLGSGSASVTFNSLRFALKDGGGTSIDQGTATIDPNVALDVSASPLDWSLVDPSSFSGSGVRLSLDRGVTLSKDGLTFNGGGSAQAQLQSQQFSGLDLSFKNNFTIGTQPVTVTDGRANLSRPQSNSPLIWFDAQGLHTSFGAVAEAVVPDTLGLPTTDVAYLVLRDPNTDNLLVDVSETQGGDVQIQTPQNTSLDLVLAGLGDASPPRTSVTLDTRIDDAGNAQSLDLSLPDLNLGADYPFTLKKVHYRPNRQTPLGISAAVDLPALLQTGPALTVDLAVGANGFEGRARPGTFSKKHRASLESQAPVAEVQHPNAANATFTAKVRGLDIQFGTDPSQHTYRISGDFQTPLLSSTGPGGTEPVLLHFQGTYSAQSWSLTGTASHIQGDLPMGVGSFDPKQTDGIVVSASDTEFSLKLNGVFAADGLLKDFEVTVQDLKVGLKKPQGQTTRLLASVGSATISQKQKLSLFGGTMEVTVNTLSVGLKRNPLAVTTTVDDGTLSFLRPDKAMKISGLQVGSDGSFKPGTVETSDLQVLGKHLTLSSLAFSQPGGSGSAQVNGTAKARLPEPLASTADTDITVKRAGGSVTADVKGPQFDLDNGDHKIGNNPATEFDFSSFATFDLTDVGINLNIGQSNRTPALQAAASLYLNDNTSKRIDFGNSANLEKKPGVEIGLQQQGGGYAPDVRFSATAEASEDNPLFEFDRDLLNVTLTQLSISKGSGGPLTVTIGGSAGFDVEAVFGSVTYKGLEINKNGVNSGEFQGGTFGILPSNPKSDNPDPLFKLELGSFERGRNTKLPSAVDTYAGDLRSMPSQKEKGTEQPVVERYLQFASQQGSALNITLNAGEGPGMGGGVDEVLFYRTQNDESELQISGVNFQMQGAADVDATLKYANVSGGFGLRVVGSAHVGGDLYGKGNKGPGGTLIGTFESVPNRKLSIGMFFSVSGGFPVLPGLLDVSDAGIGFFLRADPKLINQAEKAADLSDKPIIQSRREEIRTRNKTFFTAKVFGGVGLIGSSGAYAFEGTMMLTVTGSYALADQVVEPGSVVPIGGTEISSVLGVNWKKESFSGAFYGEIGAEVASASMGASFFAGSDGWALYTAGTGYSDVGGAGLDVQVLGGLISAEGDMVLSSEGFYLAYRQDVTIPKKGVVQIKSGVDMSLWALTGRSEVGAYFRAWAKIEAGPATIGTEVKGAYIRDAGGNLVYGYGAVHVIFGKVAGHVAMRDGGAKVGLGKNEEYEKKINRMKRRAKTMEQKAVAAKRSAEQMKKAAVVPSPDELGTPEEDLVQAGYRFYADQQARSRAKQGMEDLLFLEAADDDPRRKMFNAIYDVAGEIDQGSVGEAEIDRAWKDMEQKINRLRDVAQDVQQRLEESESQLQRLVAENKRRSPSFSSPVGRVQMAPRTSSGGTVELPSFRINEGQAKSNAQTSMKVKQAREAVGERYRKALSAALLDLQTFDRVASGTSIVDYRQLGRSLDLSELGSLDLGDLSSPPDGPATFNEASTDNETPTETSDETSTSVGRSASVGLSASGGPSTAGGPFASSGTAAVNGPSISGGTSTSKELSSKAISSGPLPESASISDVGQRYRDAIAAANEYYAKRLDYYRVRSATAREARDRKLVQFSQSGRPGNGDDVKAALEGSYPRPQYQSEFESVKDRIRRRYEVIDRLLSKSGPGDRWDEEDFKWNSGGLNAQGRKELRKIWVDSGMELWWKIHKKGLKAYADSTRRQARRVAGQYRDKIHAMKKAHRDFTETVDQFYALKADMTTITYGMAEEYIEWRTIRGGGAPDANPDAKYKQILTSLAASLEPPKIQSITAQGSNQGYYSRVQIQWSAVPQSNQGRLAEVSYDIGLDRYNRSQSLTNARFRTIGGGETSSITFYAFSLADQLSQPVMNRTYDMGLRVRGGGGNTAAQTAQFTANIHPDNSQPGPSGSIATKDKTPPTKPKVQIQNMWAQAGAEGGVYPKNGGTRGIDSYWANDSSMVRLVIKSRDPESDVTKIEYAVGSLPGQIDRQGWTQVPGTRLSDGQNQSGVNWNQRITIRGLDLSGGTEETYLYLRTTNGAGLTSKTKRVQDPFYYDSTPPVVDTSAIRTSIHGYEYPARPDPRQSPKYDGKETGSVQDAPGWDSPRVNAPAQSTVDPVEMEVSVPGTDPESGVLERKLTLLDTPVDPGSAFSRSAVCSPGCWRSGSAAGEFIVDWTATGASFADTLYAYVKTTNWVEESTVVEVPISPHDRSRPTTPTARVRPRPKGATLHLTQKAADLESGVAGYRYAVGTSKRGTDVRDYPETGVDFSGPESGLLAGVGRLSGQLPFSASRRPPLSITIPEKELPSQGYFVSVMAVNENGETSRVATSGPAAYDSTPPPRPILTTQYVGSDEPDDRGMRFEARRMGDPESGLRKNTVGWEVRPLLTGAVAPLSGSFQEARLGTGTFSRVHTARLPVENPEIYEALGYRVTLTLENGAGMTRTVEADQLIGQGQWSGESRDTWRSESRRLFKSGVSPSRLLEVRKTLSSYDQDTRQWLLTGLDVAPSSGQKKAFLQNLSALPAEDDWPGSAPSPWRQVVLKLLRESFPVPHVVKTREALDVLPPQERTELLERLLERLENAQTRAQRKATLRELWNMP